MLEPQRFEKTLNICTKTYKVRTTAQMKVLDFFLELQKTVLFVEQTKGEILAKRVQEAENRLTVMTGYRVRVTENCGSQLCRVLPNTWQGEDCTRLDCGHGGYKLENCKRRNVLYESFCTACKHKRPVGWKWMESRWILCWRNRT